MLVKTRLAKSPGALRTAALPVALYAFSSGPPIKRSGVSADVLYAGLAPASISGLYQFNVRIPPSVGDGDIPVSITLGSYKTQAGATIAVKR
jgi:uncharacterized protein (TIGR03437 family)